VAGEIGGLGLPPRPTEAISKYIVCDHIWDYSQKDKDYIWDNLHCFDIKEQKAKLILLYGTVELMEQDVTGHGAHHKPHAAKNELDKL
jgi:hypothetical protein